MATNATTSPGDVAALVPPPGLQSNFSAQNPLQNLVIVAMAVCIFLSTAFTCFRMYAQARLFGTLTWSDIWMLIAWGSHMAFCALLLTVLPLGAGQHQWDVRLSDYNRIEYLLYIGFIVYSPAVACAKIAILTQLKNIFTGTHKGKVLWGIQVILWANVAFYLGATIAVIFECEPRKRAWNPTVPGHCLDQTALLTSTGPLNLVSDFFIFFLPAWAIWHLQMPVQKKFSVSAAFTIGFFGCSCSAVRIAYTSRLSDSKDGTYNIMQNQMWANAEITIAIIIAAIIILPRFLHTIKANSSYGSNRFSKVPKRRISHFIETGLSDDIELGEIAMVSGALGPTPQDIDGITMAEPGNASSSTVGFNDAPRGDMLRSPRRVRRTPEEIVDGAGKAKRFIPVTSAEDDTSDDSMPYNAYDIFERAAEEIHGAGNAYGGISLVKEFGVADVTDEPLPVEPCLTPIHRQFTRITSMPSQAFNMAGI